MPDKKKTVLRIDVDEEVKIQFRSDSMAARSNMSIDIEVFMVERNRLRSNPGAKVSDEFIAFLTRADREE
jgi:hypothetical protein